MVAEGPLGRWLMGNQIPGAVGIIASLRPVPPPWMYQLSNDTRMTILVDDGMNRISGLLGSLE